MSDQENGDRKMLPPPPKGWLPRGGTLATSALAIVLIAGAALGAGGTKLAQNWQPRQVMLLQPAGIDKMTDGAPVAIKGEVSEVFGNKFVLQDASGRALVDTGPRGEDRAGATKGEAVTVQGRFERGIVRAELIAHADGRNEGFGPPPRGPKGPKGAKDAKEGPRADRGPPPPEDDENAPPSPPQALPR